jgi:hypothetical protein
LREQLAHLLKLAHQLQQQVAAEADHAEHHLRHHQVQVVLAAVAAVDKQQAQARLLLHLVKEMLAVMQHRTATLVTAVVAVVQTQ